MDDTVKPLNYDLDCTLPSVSPAATRKDEEIEAATINGSSPTPPLAAVHV